MITFFRNLKIRTKLFAGFFSLSLVLLFVGIRQFVVLRSLGESQSYIVQSLASADAIMETRYYVRSDMQLKTEMSQTDNIEKLDDLMRQHENIVYNIINIFNFHPINTSK